MKRYLDTAKLCERYSRSRMTIWRWQRDPSVSFPRPDLTISGNPLWAEATLDAFDARMARQPACDPQAA